MIYKFRSKAAGDVIMLGPNGDEVMRLVGKEPAAQGIIEPAAMPGAIAALELAVAADEAAIKAARESSGGDADTAKQPRGGITLRQRVWPLVEMMKRCQTAGQEIVWGT